MTRKKSVRHTTCLGAVMSPAPVVTNFASFFFCFSTWISKSSKTYCEHSLFGNKKPEQKQEAKKKKGLCFGNCYPPLWAFFSTWCCICFHPFPQLCMERTVERVVLGGGGSFWGSWTLFTSQRESGVSTKQPKWAIVIGLLKCRSFYEGMWQWSACLDKKKPFQKFFLPVAGYVCMWLVHLIGGFNRRRVVPFFSVWKKNCFQRCRPRVGGMLALCQQELTQGRRTPQQKCNRTPCYFVHFFPTKPQEKETQAVTGFGLREYWHPWQSVSRANWKKIFCGFNTVKPCTPTMPAQT